MGRGFGAIVWSPEKYVIVGRYVFWYVSCFVGDKAWVTREDHDRSGINHIIKPLPIRDDHTVYLG